MTWVAAAPPVSHFTLTPVAVAKVWVQATAPAIGAAGQFTTVRPVTDIDAGIDFMFAITQTGDFAVSSVDPVFISSQTILDP